MQFSEKRNITRWIIIMASFVIVSLILWNTYTFFQIFKNEERLKMEVWANAQKSLINANETTDVDLPLQIFNNNTTIPLILMENNTIRSTANIDEKIVNDKNKTKIISIHFVGVFKFTLNLNLCKMNTTNKANENPNPTLINTKRNKMIGAKTR